MCNMNTKHHLNILMDKLHLVSLNQLRNILNVFNFSDKYLMIREWNEQQRKFEAETEKEIESEKLLRFN